MNHEAWHQVRRSPGPPGGHRQVFFFEKKGGLRLQTTAQACEGSPEEAARVCRLCYVRAEKGAPEGGVTSKEALLD